MSEAVRRSLLGVSCVAYPTAIIETISHSLAVVVVGEVGVPHLREAGSARREP